MHINLNLRGESRLSEANVEKVNISPFSGPSMTVLKKYELIHQFVCLLFFFIVPYPCMNGITL